MVRFSCFSTPIHYNKSKKIVQHAGGAMHFTHQVLSQDQPINFPAGSASSNPKMDDNNLSNISMEQVTSPSSHEGCWKSEDLNNYSCPEDGKRIPQITCLRKSQSLGNVSDKNKGFPCDDVTEDDEVDQRLRSNDNKMKRFGSSFNKTGQHQENGIAESFDSFADPVHHESLFSIAILEQSDGEQHDDVGEQSADHVDSEHFASDIHPVLTRSHSVTNIGVNDFKSTGDSLNSELMAGRSRSFENLSSVSGRRVEILDREETSHSEVAWHRCKSVLQPSDVNGQGLICHADLREECHFSNTSGSNEVEDLERDGMYMSEKFKYRNRSTNEKGSPHYVDSVEECLHSNTSGGFDEAAGHDRDDNYCQNLKHYNQSVDGGDYHSYNGEEIDRRDPETAGAETGKNLQEGFSIQNWVELTSKEYNIRRIEDWISQIDIQNDNIVEELGECSSSASKEDPQIVAGAAAKKLDVRSSLGMEVAYNYISTLNAASSSAQMANLGLVAIPILSAFVGLRVLNLSGNSIVRVTIGALPRGLHMLNLSKNNISTIEGLRELTRLRVLDLSYNRICRIGHGLASCSSLKELYLAGNKIGDVEGLHRLLKLNVLDLRSNKISTSKGLGQLAANYGSLQAINLEGNPAQKNVGDEQLKKYLLSLLPHLVFYNKQTIRASGAKEISDRPTRSLSSHQFDRSMRTEQKSSRRGSLVAALHKSSNHGRSGHPSKLSKSRNGHVPPFGFKPTDHLLNIDRKLSRLQHSNPIRRIQSEGAL
ncbi:uncharacterized protein [Elaeis guineensis]|uniref:Uncharacterized protein LOC105049660 isoform X2 n=1 Tax=Elaeis guineensis var. tenera TaxID=51953 RepID=A0A6I9RSK0_ELAGV|nr:uncharacterized protein LOC105049660 isoform X2 [Elaeis guineensis]